MKKALLLSLLIILFAYSAQAQVKISQQPNGGNAGSTDTVTILRGGANYKANIPLGSTTTAGLLQCGTGITCSGGTINGASYPTQTGNAYEYLMTDGSNVLWGNPASLIDPRTTGATCAGPNFVGGGAGTLGTSGNFISNGGSGYLNATYTSVPLTGGNGTGAQATIVVSGNIVTSVTVTTAGTGYHLRDVLSASNTNLGGSGSGFTYLVGAFGSNSTPTYPGTDDTAGFNGAFAAALSTGQGVLVPNGCWVTTLNIPQGITMVGEGWNPNYEFNTNGGTATNPPVLYSHGGATNVINIGPGSNNAFVGFEINALGGSGFQSQYCIGTTSNLGGGSPYITAMNMSFKNCLAGIGATTNQMFVHSYNNDYGANAYGIFGNMSDLVSDNDNFAAMSNEGIHLSGGAGLVRISNDRFEYSPIGIEIANYGNINMSNNEFDHLSNESVLLSSSSASVYIVNSTMQASGTNANGSCNTGGHQAHIALARTTTSPANLYVSNTHFDLEGTTCSKYVLSVLTTGADNDNLFISGGDGSGYTTSFINSVSGKPPHVKFNTFGTPPYDSTQTTFTISGCSATSAAGGNASGTFTSGTTGTCTVTVTPNGAASVAQPNGWSCGNFADLTTNGDTSSWQQTASSTTTATISGTTVSGDSISFSCAPY